MKKNLFATLALASFTGSMFAQLPVSTTPSNKKAVLEEFTGINCTWCPAGHAIANAMVAADPTNVILINIHSGSFATAGAGQPDFKTPEGNAIDIMSGMNIAGYPAGDINRVVFPGNSQNTSNPGMAQNRSTWTNTGNTIKTQPAYCNVALQGTLNVQTRVLTVDVQVYYTANGATPTNSLNVFLLEDDVPGPQINGSSANMGNYNTDGTYRHNHVLRKALTPTFGMTIPNTAMTTLFTTQLTYTVPATYGVGAGKTTIPSLGNLELVAFVTETDRNTINADDGPITLTNFANTLDIGTSNLGSEESVCAVGLVNPRLKFANNGSTPVTSAEFTYAVNGGAPLTYTWTGAAVNPLTNSQTFTLPGVSFTPLANNTLVVSAISVNGSADQNATNNVSTKNNIAAPVANSLNMQMDFTQDRYGSECSWVLYDEMTNAVISSDGPWSDLAANGILLHTKTFTVNPATCYKLVVTDSYGDGINAGYGVGGYILKAGGTSFITSNGQFGSGETKLYKTYTISNPVGLNEASSVFAGISMFPNPSNGLTKIGLELLQNEKVSVNVYNQIGQLVFAAPAKELSAGSNEIEMNTSTWAAGLYNVVVNGSNGSVTKKLTVSK